LGAIPTGVSVVTIVDAEGVDRGMTVGALCSVSLGPPLLLVCIGDRASLAATIRSATCFGVSVLAEDQLVLSERFAGREARDFEGLLKSRGPLGTALLDGAAAHFECEILTRYPGGDHSIILGEVHYAEATWQLPLVHHRGAYSRISE
jgi:flavin reductase (DIM6/NTAB) family NADH-FMN oxidoreductase RutF